MDKVVYQWPTSEQHARRFSEALDRLIDAHLQHGPYPDSKETPLARAVWVDSLLESWREELEERFDLTG